jgi:hypothetical protein
MFYVVPTVYILNESINQAINHSINHDIKTMYTCCSSSSSNNNVHVAGFKCTILYFYLRETFWKTSAYRLQNPVGSEVGLPTWGKVRAKINHYLTRDRILMQQVLRDQHEQNYFTFNNNHDTARKTTYELAT